MELIIVTVFIRAFYDLICFSVVFYICNFIGWVSFNSESIFWSGIVWCMIYFVDSFSWNVIAHIKDASTDKWKCLFGRTFIFPPIIMYNMWTVYTVETNNQKCSAVIGVLTCSVIIWRMFFIFICVCCCCFFSRTIQTVG